MDTNLFEMGKRIAELRESCGYSREEMAQDFGIDLETYASYEENGVDVPISIIFQMANKFGVDFTEIITGNAAKLTSYHIVPAGKGRHVDRYPGYSYKDLAFRYSHKIMQPLLVSLEPSEKPSALVIHKGQEFNFVVQGTIILTLDEKEFVLNEGDSIYFNAMHPHSQQCGGNSTAVFLTVIAE